MSTVSARIPQELQETLREYTEEENLGESAAVRKLLIDGLERWERQRALRLFQEGRISFMKAAKKAQMYAWSFASLLGEEGIAWVDEEAVRDDLEKA